MNCCAECRKPFQITVDPDICESCRIILGIRPGEYRDNETQPGIVKEIMDRYTTYA